jgi:hypothetical protein
MKKWIIIHKLFQRSIPESIWLSIWRRDERDEFSTIREGRNWRNDGLEDFRRERRNEIPHSHFGRTRRENRSWAFGP